MELVQIIATVIFLGSIVLVITGWIDSVIAAILGIIVMILFGVMTEVQGFHRALCDRLSHILLYPGNIDLGCSVSEIRKKT